MWSLIYESFPPIRGLMEQFAISEECYAIIIFMEWIKDNERKMLHASVPLVHPKTNVMKQCVGWIILGLDHL